MRVCVDVRGSYVHKRKGRLVVRSPVPIMVTEYKQATFGFFEAEEGVVDRRYRWQKVTRRGSRYFEFETPFWRVKELWIEGDGVAITADVIKELCEANVPIHFMDWRGRSVALLLSPHLVGMVKTRRAQLEAYGDRRGYEFARGVVSGKMRNQMALLRYFGKHLKEKDAGRWEELMGCVRGIGVWLRRVRVLEGGRVEEVRGRLLEYEAHAGEAYWRGIGIVLGGRYEFEGRRKRGATDRFNQALNYGYAILQGVVTGALQTAGLDPYGGFLHADRSGRASLVLDFMEEFRQAVVDRAVVSLFNLGVRMRGDAEGLDVESRRQIRERIEGRLSSRQVWYGRSLTIGGIIQFQARRLAVALRGEGRYRPFVMKW